MSSLHSDPLKQKREFFAINGLRFFAASWVLLFHTSIHFGKLPNLSWLQPMLDQGVLAMTLFFMLSGFILSYRYSQFPTIGDIHNYAAARVARLYPVYLFMGLITIWTLPTGISRLMLFEHFGLLGAGFVAMMAIFLSLFAIQAWFPGLFLVWNIGGSWSLSVEAFFYSLFPFLRNRIGKLGVAPLRVIFYGMPAILGLILLGMIASFSSVNDTSRIFYLLPVFRLPEFVFGIAGYVLFVERGLDRRCLALVSGISSAALVVCIYLKDLPGLIDFGSLATLSFMGVFVFCLKLDAPILIKESINYLGRISYCVYMAQFATIPILKRYKATLPLEGQWVAVVTSTMLLAMVTYHFVEVRAYTRTQVLSLRLSRWLSDRLRLG